MVSEESIACNMKIDSNKRQVFTAILINDCKKKVRIFIFVPHYQVMAFVDFRVLVFKNKYIIKCVFGDI